MPYFGPFVRKPYVFKKDENLKRFILSKLINAEYASLRAPAFSQFSEKTFKQSLNKLCENLADKTHTFALDDADRVSHNNALNQTKSIPSIDSSIHSIDKVSIVSKKTNRFSFFSPPVPISEKRQDMEKSMISSSFHLRRRLDESPSIDEPATVNSFNFLL